MRAGPEIFPLWKVARGGGAAGLIAALALLAGPARAERLPAPRGDPAEVAAREIAAAPYPCPKVEAATRRQSDRAIIATCAGGQRFLIFRQRGYAGSVVMRCEMAPEFRLSCKGAS